MVANKITGEEITDKQAEKFKTSEGCSWKEVTVVLTDDGDTVQIQGKTFSEVMQLINLGGTAIPF